METEISEAAEKMGGGSGGEDFETGAGGSASREIRSLTGAVALVPTVVAPVSEGLTVEVIPAVLG